MKVLAARIQDPTIISETNGEDEIDIGADR